MIDALEKITRRTSIVFVNIGGFVLAVMMVVSFLDVLGRYFFNMPIAGAYELIKFMMVVVIAFGLAYCAIEKGHVIVDVLLLQFSQRTRNIIEIPISFISLIIFILITWRTAIYVDDMIHNLQTKSEVLHIPGFPFVALLFLGFAVFTMELLVEFLNSISRAARRK